MPASVTRRIFLAGAGSLAAAAGDLAANDAMGVGMIAVGARAHQLIESIKLVRGVEIRSVFDAYTGRIERAVERTGGRAKAAQDYQEILNDDSIDAVFIASPDHWHARQTVEALEAGKHVYCEKPLTYTVDEGLEIAKAAKKSGRVLQVGSQGISTKNQQRAKAMIAEGRAGRVTMVRANYNRNSPGGAWLYPIPPDASPTTVDWDLFLGSAPRHDFDLEHFFRWRCYSEYSGGIATDLFVHLCTTIHELMGAKMPAEVTAFGDLYRWKDSRNVPDTLNAVLRYSEGFSVTLGSTFNNSTGGSGFEFLGTEGAISLGYSTLAFQAEAVRDSHGWIIESWPSDLQAEYEMHHPRKRIRRPEPEEYVERGPSSTDHHVASFFDSIRESKPVVEDVWAGHHAAACAHMVNASAATGRPVRWDFERKRIAT